jgi:hypothetical protein
MGGAKLADELQALRPEMKMLFVSGYAEKTVLQHGAINVEEAFLQKPFSLRDLFKKVREVLDVRNGLPPLRPRSKHSRMVSPV